MHRLVWTMTAVLWMFLGVTPAFAQPARLIFVNDLAWSPDNKRLAIATSQGVQVYELNEQGMTRLWSLPMDQRLDVITFSPSGQVLAAGTQRPLDRQGAGNVYVWESQTGKQITSFQGNESGVYSLAFSPDGAQLAVGGGEWWIPIFSYVRFWRTGDWSEDSIRRLNGRGIVSTIAYSPNGQWFAYGSEDGSVYLIDTAVWAAVSAIHERAGDLQFAPDNIHLWTQIVDAPYQPRLEKWEIRSSPETYLFQLDQQQAIVYGNTPTGEIIIGSNSHFQAAASNEGMIRVWSLEDGYIEHFHVEAGKRFSRAIFSPDETRLALVGSSNITTADSSNSVSIWTLATGEYQTLNLGGE